MNDSIYPNKNGDVITQYIPDANTTSYTPLVTFLANPLACLELYILPCRDNVSRDDVVSRTAPSIFRLAKTRNIIPISHNIRCLV